MSMLKPEFMLGQTLNEIKLTIVLLMPKRKIYFQGSVKYRRVDKFVWNHNTMALPVTLDALDCKIIIRHLNGTTNKILNNLHYNIVFTLLENHFFPTKT